MNLLDNAFPDITYKGDIQKKTFKLIDTKKGTFGEVNMITSNHTLHVIKKIYFAEGLIEVIILKKLYNDNSKKFLPKILKIDIIDEHLLISMTYCGRDLHALAKKIPEEQRIQLIPSMLSQMLIILDFLQENTIIHGDIKPQNITMTLTTEPLSCNIYLIDFGFATPYNKYTKSYSGTYEFSHPNYFTWDKQIDYSHDVYAFAMVLLYFISNRYIMCEKFTTMNGDKCIESVDFDIYVKSLKYILDKPIFSKIDKLSLDCIKKMMCIGENNIIDVNGIPLPPKQLYDSLCLSIESIKNIGGLVFKNIDISIIPNYINLFIANVCMTIETPQVFQYARLLFIKLKPKRNLRLYALSCIIIGNYIFHSISGDYFNDILQDACDILNSGDKNTKGVKYSKHEILTSIFNIGQYLNWNLCPMVQLEDWDKNVQDMTIYPYIVKLTAKKTIETILKQSIGKIMLPIF
jgi:serine/threonine protein kinase